jgi:ABC-type lipoprotein export system ATPase subunit
VLVAQHLTFAYRGTEEILRDLSHSFPDGSTTAISGASGCGKSTLLFLLGLLATPTAGTVSLDGEVISGRSDPVAAHLRSTKVGFVFQDAMLDASRTVLDNVTEPAVYAGVTRSAARKAAFELLERFSVEHRADHRPGEISGGQAQRIALCRAFVNQPRIVLADEPTGNLDSMSATVVLDALTEAAHAGSIVVIVTHDDSIVERCDRSIRLSA